MGACELCGRSSLETTTHHLIPRGEGGSHLPTAQLCKACHKMIHAMYTNRDLVILGLTTIPALQQDSAIAAYLGWNRKQPAGAKPRVKKSARVRGRKE
ncbi:hypothetical protein J22TS3_28910 [Paenibacillus sp. J22TS3]|nr:HNH endonuclease [Paenibacillus sp. J22TS3]GIP22616.1 hypothetical protein J22TS3_28910 [Paenibacillus sp. J22TS3]